MANVHTPPFRVEAASAQRERSSGASHYKTSGPDESYMRAPEDAGGAPLFTPRRRRSPQERAAPVFGARQAQASWATQRIDPTERPLSFFPVAAFTLQAPSPLFFFPFASLTPGFGNTPVQSVWGSA
ncbi:hypothetical protein MRX96_055382 [Rhipicephalus microplus]